MPVNREKNARIAATQKATRQRHAGMVCRTFDVKVVSNKLNLRQKEQVNGLFREAKWIRNSLINDMDSVTDKSNTVSVKVGDHFEERRLEYIGSQIIQSHISSVRSEIKGLHTKKEKGYKVGALKCKSYCNSVTLKQYGNTFSINRSKNRIRVQKISNPFYVRGLKQIPENAEIACAKFVREPDGLHFRITCFIPPQPAEKTGHIEGIDFGIGHNLTYTDGRTDDICIPESKGIRLASKRVNKGLLRNGGDKKSHNHRKRVYKLKAAYQKNTNSRRDKANKIVHNILANNDFIAIQDEMIHNWHAGLFGKQIQHSAMGLIKAKLKLSSKVHVVGRSFPSTQICPVCGSMTKHKLIKRDYDCACCGYHHDSRDQKSAISILNKALEETQFVISV